MLLQPSLDRLQVLMQLEEDYAELDRGLAQLLQQRRRRRRAQEELIRRRTDFEYYERLMHKLKDEGREAFTTFLRVPSELF